MLRMVGQKKWPVTPIRIGKSLPGKSGKDRVYRPGLTDPYMPARASDDYHPGGNSVCYMIQTAHLMGCDPIYLLGFTLQSGSGYFFGMNNPVLKRRAKYQDDGARPIHWLRWYSKRYPGRVLLWPGWQGPIYDVFETEDLERLNG